MSVQYWIFEARKLHTGSQRVLQSYGDWKCHVPGPGKFWEGEDFQNGNGKFRIFFGIILNIS